MYTKNLYFRKFSVLNQNQTTTVQKAKVLYAYKAENPDELNLQVGDIVVVLDQAVEDVGWWKGELKGKIGVFPDNFVTLLPLEEVILFFPIIYYGMKFFQIENIH